MKGGDPDEGRMATGLREDLHFPHPTPGEPGAKWASLCGQKRTSYGNSNSPEVPRAAAQRCSRTLACHSLCVFDAPSEKSCAKPSQTSNASWKNGPQSRFHVKESTLRGRRTLMILGPRVHKMQQTLLFFTPSSRPTGLAFLPDAKPLWISTSYT